MNRIVGLLLLFSGISASGQTISRKAILQEGQSFERTVEIKSVMTMNIAGKSQEFAEGMNLISMINVKARTDSGFEINCSTRKFNLDGKEKVTKDSAGGTRAPKIGTTLIDKNGNIILSTDTNYITKQQACFAGSSILLKAALRGPGEIYELTAPLPFRSLRVGDEWSDTFHIKKMAVSILYMLKAVNSEEAIVSLSGKANGESELDELGQPGKLKIEAITTGILKLDPGTGILKSIIENTEAKGIFELPTQTQSATIKTTVTSTVRSR